jgi:hypothetical protein
MVVFSRIPFMSHFLYEWDSVNYALAFQNFNIYLSQPQPPGYIFFVTLGKIINFLLNDPNTSMIFLSITLSVLTVFLIYFLVKQMFSREIAVVASILLIFNPIFWFYGETATIYMSEAFFATLIAYTSFKLLMGDNRFIYISSIALGLSGGFREDILVFMFPLWFFCLCYHDFDYKKIFKSFIVLIASAMLWFIPTILLSGGYWKYSQITQATLVSSFKLSSIFFGSNITSQLIMDNMLLSWTILGMGIISMFFLLLFIIFNLKKVLNLSNLQNRKLIFLILWIIPAFLFYLLLFIAKSGYTLVYLPVFAVVIGYVIIDISLNLNKKFLKIPKNYFIILLISLYLLGSVTQFILSTDSNQENYSNIKLQDNENLYVNESLEAFNPENTLVMFQGGTDWRKSMYYYPNYQTYLFYQYNSSGTTLLHLNHYKNNEIGSYDGMDYIIHINSSTDNVVWIVDENSEFFKQLQSKIGVKTMLLPDGYLLYYSKVKNNTNFTIDNVTFIK